VTTFRVMIRLIPYLIAALLLTILLFPSCSDREKAEFAFKKSIYQTLSLEERRQPENALLALETHRGLEVTLFASEPMVTNPTNIDVDSRGRVWVCEAYNYGLTKNQIKEEGGKISILEDTDGDGAADKKTVFYQGEEVNIALGIAVMGNKVYVTRSPRLLVFTDEDGDDKPDKKEILFTGMGDPGDHSAHAVIAGPDGKLYFNYGNLGKKVLYPDGSPVKDTFGDTVISNGKPYYGGMIFRCNPDGTAFEVLGHNFRNNYEVTVDSYGNIWQSDNDDDGNASCRINYILEHGNYGYLDEMTGAHWSVPRTGQSDKIPERHWHQNDPGTVPNLLITGAGSPAGICFYEGDPLPEVFRNQMIHTDAGPNVVRAYPVEKSGAGFSARIENILWSEKDKWFRPVDVTVAPDGSLMVADWYDPIVGGGAVGDFVPRGRIYRVAPPGFSYHINEQRVDRIRDAVNALKSPSLSRQYLGREFLLNKGAESEKSLCKLWYGENPVYRARALWILGKIPGKGMDYIEEALKDQNEDIRITAIRMATELKLPYDQFISNVIQDPSPQVRRTAAISLTSLDHDQKAIWWAMLADQYDGQDPWYLEALGISASGNWDDCFNTWYDDSIDLRTKANQDIVWRARAQKALELKARIIQDPASDSLQIIRFFRSFDFHEQKEKDEVLLSLIPAAHPLKNLITSLVIQHINPDQISMSPGLLSAIRETLEEVRGTQDFVTIVDRYNLESYREDLLDLAINEGPTSLGINAMKVLAENPSIQGIQPIKRRISQNSSDGETVMQLLAPISTRNSLTLIRETILTSGVSLRIKRAGILALGQSWWGEDFLLEMVRERQIENSLKPTASSVLFSVYRATIREEAARYLEKPGLAGGNDLPPVRDLLSYQGNPEKGRSVYEAHCKTCHRIGGEGTNFGPELSLIGDKLSKEGLFQAIIYPNQGINNGYEGYALQLKDGGVLTGLLLSQTDDQILLRQVGGYDQTLKKSEIKDIEIMDQSLMTELAGVMSQQQLVDLVEYLSTLTKGDSTNL
jgi:putative membrane-bound dehydrogenase-like protein